MIMKQEMQKSIFKIQTAVETLTRQKVIDKNVYDFVHREIKSLLESVENIVEEITTTKLFLPSQIRRSM